MRAIPEDFWEDVPPGAESERSISGMPEIFAVNWMLPLARADIGRPDGAKMTDSDSTIST